jgi:hypothetical protein
MIIINHILNRIITSEAELSKELLIGRSKCKLNLWQHLGHAGKLAYTFRRQLLISDRSEPIAINYGWE